MSGWKEWPCICINDFEEETMSAVYTHIKKYLRLKKKQLVYRDSGIHETFFYIQDEKLLSYIILRWGDKLDVLEPYNTWKKKMNKYAKEVRTQTHAETREHREYIRSRVDPIINYVGVKDPILSYSQDKQNWRANFDIETSSEAMFSIHDL